MNNSMNVTLFVIEEYPETVGYFAVPTNSLTEEVKGWMETARGKILGTDDTEGYEDERALSNLVQTFANEDFKDDSDPPHFGMYWKYRVEMTKQIEGCIDDVFSCGQVL